MEGLKFRAWRKGISYIFSKPYLLAEYTVLSFLPEDEELKGINCFGYDDFEFDCIEQFTGLKDKNDKEIYEGDIVIYDFARYTDKGPEPIAGIVKYSTESAAYGIVPLAYPDSIEWFGELAINAPLEVIGNIHDKEDK